MQFNWEEFMDKNNKIVVHCKTEEEAIDFCSQMNTHGMKWYNGDSYLKKNNWDKYKEETCYKNNGCFASFLFYKENYKEMKFIEWSDYMKKDPIDYLKYGYVVEFENGEFGMYMPSKKGDFFDYGNGTSCLPIHDDTSYYDKELKFNNKITEVYKVYNFSEYNVKRIYGYSNIPYKTTRISLKDRPLIWERPKEVKKMTVSEICKELGYKVEIVE